MASIMKFQSSAVTNILRHNERTMSTTSNPDIQPELNKQNYSLAPNRNMSSYQYFKHRKSELYCYNRKDVIQMCGWIVSAPQNLQHENEKNFLNVLMIF